MRSIFESAACISSTSRGVFCAEITKRLIAERGFSAVAVEADWPDAYRVNRFVRGTGTDRTALGALGGFERFPAWMWRNTDVLAFIALLKRSVSTVEACKSTLRVVADRFEDLLKEKVESEESRRQRRRTLRDPVMRVLPALMPGYPAVGALGFFAERRSVGKIDLPAREDDLHQPVAGRSESCAQHLVAPDELFEAA